MAERCAAARQSRLADLPVVVRYVARPAGHRLTATIDALKTLAERSKEKSRG